MGHDFCHLISSNCSNIDKFNVYIVSICMYLVTEGLTNIDQVHPFLISFFNETLYVLCKKRIKKGKNE
jgi:hypothetical protein